MATQQATPQQAASITRINPLPIMLRFISCGLISLSAGAIWRFTLAPSQVAVGSALLGILCLLAGFVLGGVLWYLRDSRARVRDPNSVSDERIIFSFTVFALVPFAVLIVVLVVWLIALLVGA